MSLRNENAELNNILKSHLAFFEFSCLLLAMKIDALSNANCLSGEHWNILDIKSANKNDKNYRISPLWFHELYLLLSPIILSRMSDFIPYLSKSLGDKSYSRFTETWRQRSTSGRSIDGGLHGQCAQFPTIKDDEIIRGKMRRKCWHCLHLCIHI